MTGDDVTLLLDRFRAKRRAFVERLDRIPTENRERAPTPGYDTVREVVIVAAAWLEEANDRIPRLIAGAPEVEHDRDAFAAAALGRSAGWSYDRAVGAFRRAADRLEMMIAESNADELIDEPPVMQWLECLAGPLIQEYTDALDRLIRRFNDEASGR